MMLVLGFLAVVSFTILWVLGIGAYLGKFGANTATPLIGFLVYMYGGAFTIAIMIDLFGLRA